MSQIFEASRLSGGNRLFPCKVIVEEPGITVKIPGMFRGKEEFISYDQISSVRLNTPLIGFSDIIIDTTGWGRVTATGFTKDQVQEMKELIQRGKSQQRSVGNTFHTVENTIHTTESDEVKLSRLELEKKKLELEESERKRREESDRQFYQWFSKNWKIWVPIVVVLVCFFGYNSYHTNNKSSVKSSVSEQTTISESYPSELIGNWKGSFGNSDIQLSIENISQDGTVKGYDLVKNTKRPLTGTIVKSGENYSFTLKEPGNEKWDGTFNFVVSGNTCKGSWKSNNGKLFKEYTLTK